MGAPPLMDMPLFESGLETEGGSTFSVAIANPFESCSALPLPVRAAPAFCSRLVDCLRHPQTRAGHRDRPEVPALRLHLLLSPREKVASPNALAVVVGEDLAQACRIIARSALECRKSESCSCLDRAFLSPSRLCRQTSSPCPDCRVDT